MDAQQFLLHLTRGGQDRQSLILRIKTTNMGQNMFPLVSSFKFKTIKSNSLKKTEIKGMFVEFLQTHGFLEA